MPKLLVTRTSEWNNRMREIGIYLNNEKIGVIGNGEIKEFEVTGGMYVIRAKIDWCGSNHIEVIISDDETTSVEVSGLKLMKWLMPAALLFNVFFFLTYQTLNIPVFIYMIFMIPLMGYLLYILTFGRNQYLALKET